MRNTSNSSSFNKQSISVAELNVWIIFQFGFGIIGTFLLIVLLISMYRLKKLSTGSGILIAHSLIIDIIFCIICNPITNMPIYLTQMRVPFSYHCVFSNFVTLSVVYAGNWVAVILAINRFIAIILPHFYTKVTSKFYSVTAIVFIWAIAVSCNIPRLNIVPGLDTGMMSSGSCGLTRNEGIWFTVLGTLGTYLPVALLGAVYVSLFTVSGFRKTLDGRLKQRSKRHGKNLMNKRLSIAKALFFSFVWYCVCTLPPPILTMYFSVWWRKETRMLLYARVAQVLGYAASPVFFFAMNGEYVKAVEKELGICFAFMRKLSADNKRISPDSCCYSGSAPPRLKLRSVGVLSKSS